MNSDRRVGPSTRSATVVFLDADNTLWDTDAVFAAAQLQLLQALEDKVGKRVEATDRVNFVREIDQALAERHHAGLRYPPELLVKAVAKRLSGAHAAVAVRSLISDPSLGTALPDSTILRIAQRFRGSLMVLPELRPGVRTGLAELKGVGCVNFVLTEGAREQVAHRLSEHRIDDAIYRVLEAPKHKALYDRVLRRFGGDSRRAFMVGDQLSRDIAPALAAEINTIYFPGGFRPKWDIASAIRPDFTISNFKDVPTIVIEKTMPLLRT
ncbi:MAG TPA: HAD family hydrolase [Rhizomicrobium sp.]|jgi:putative hydrolase of the HAD superfamily